MLSFAGLAGLAALRAAAGLAGFPFRGGADFALAAGALRAAAFFGAAFLAGFLDADFLFERAIKLMVRGLSPLVRNEGGLIKGN